MESYENKPIEELLEICKSKFANGRTYEELKLFLNRHKIDEGKQAYIFNELEKYEVYLKNNPVAVVKKMPIPFTPLNMVLGIALIALGLTVLIIGNMKGQFYTMSLFIAGAGMLLIGIEVVKSIINLFR